jgi:hypothetical protein
VDWWCCSEAEGEGEGEEEEKDRSQVFCDFIHGSDSLCLEDTDSASLARSYLPAHYRRRMRFDRKLFFFLFLLAAICHIDDGILHCQLFARTSHIRSRTWGKGEKFPTQHSTVLVYQVSDHSIPKIASLVVHRWNRPPAYRSLVVVMMVLVKLIMSWPTTLMMMIPVVDARLSGGHLSHIV